MKKIAIYAGSFEPPTLGHLWMMRQGAMLFDELIVVFAVNPDKKGFLTTAQRQKLFTSLQAELPANVRFLELSKGFVADFAVENGARYLLRGIRNAADFEYEKSMARINASMQPGVQTVFLTPPPELENVSSSLVRGFIGQPHWERWVKPIVPDCVFKLLTEETP